ncbi:hypothetical protein [Chryseobacterium sp. WLY505]|uniref:hypothetical protein n=1 Tax=Chryseobacterium sp. WLY505 TaxID=3068892 RepID=UPI0027966B8B|nr:hypothetical protein [Chryseobacterium sp. WLY505]MDQ1855770.1 hypothetical protein [Chryseobacterium sp. WLY505]
MNFNKIDNNTECNCLHDSYVDLNSHFARRVRKAPDMKDADFKSHFERGRITESSQCEDICGLHGVSIEIWNDVSSDVLMKKYQATANYSPKHKNNLSIFVIKSSAGRIKHTPRQIDEYNPFHYDLYKEDCFTVDCLELIEMIPLIPQTNA